MTLFDDFIAAHEKAVKAIEANGGKYVVPLNPRAQRHIKWLIDNGHMEPHNISIDALMKADKKLGITPWDWEAYS